MNFSQKLLDNFLWNLVNSTLMPVTLHTQKEFWIESKLNGFWGGFAVTFGLRNFHRGGEVKWALKKNKKNTLNFL